MLALLIGCGLIGGRQAGADTAARHLERARTEYARWRTDARPDHLETARQELERARTLAPNDATVLEWSGLIALRRQRYSEALEPLGKAARLQPNRGAIQLDLGYAYAEQERWAEAEQADRAALAAFERDPRARTAPSDLRDDRMHAWHDLAQADLRQKKLPDAAAALEQVVALAPEDAPSLEALGEILQEQGREAEALSRFDQARRLRERAFALETPSASAQLHEAIALDRTKRFAEASDRLERAVKADPHSVQALIWLGYVRIEQNQAERAVEPLHRALALDPQNGIAHLDLGQADLTLHRDQEAADEFKAVLLQQPASLSALYGLGCAEERQGRYPEAIRALRQAAISDRAGSIPPQEIHAALGRALEHTGALNEAADADEAATRLAPTRADYARQLAHVRLILAEQNASQRQQAADALARSVALAPDDLPVRSAYAALLSRMGRDDEAVAQFGEATQRDPNAFAAWMGLGAAEARRGRRPEALDAFKKAATLQPENTEAIRQMGQEALQQEKYAEAAEASERLIARTPDDPNAYLMLLFCRQRLGRKEETQAALEAGLAAADRNTRPEARAGWAPLRRIAAVDRLQRGDAEGARQARTLYEQVLQAVPGDPASLNGLGLIVQRQARDLRHRAFDALPRRGVKPADVQRAGALQQQAARCSRESIALFDQALAGRPDFADALNNRGASYEMVGDLTAAAADYRRALHADPHHAAARSNLARLDKLQRFRQPQSRRPLLRP